MHMRESSDRDELMEVVGRLRSVTNGYPTQELSLKRNATGQLGFHVQPDGVVTQVENLGLAWQAGLRQGSRLVEVIFICELFYRINMRACLCVACLRLKFIVYRYTYYLL